jgi:hypothetical protein
MFFGACEGIGHLKQLMAEEWFSWTELATRGRGRPER